MGDMAKSPFLQFVVVQFQTLSQKSFEVYTGLKFCTQVGSNNQMCNDLSKCL